MHRNDGGIVDAELLRPRWWIAQYGLHIGQLVPMNLPELEVHGAAIITDIGNCPEIAEGEGSVVTARYLTREVHAIARVTVARPSRSWIDALQAEGREPSGIELADLTDLSPNELAHLEALGLIELEVLVGTPIHPIWSEDLQSWVPLGELEIGETLRSADGPAVVLSVSIVSTSQPVYNIEVHGEHVYQVGELGLLVHNAGHHCNPVAFGNDIPYGHRLLTNLSDTAHSGLHSAMNAFLKAEQGKTLYTGRQWWTANVRWQDRYRTIIDFYRDFDKANNSNLFASFMAEVRGGILSGFNPLGR
jgi:hypothetical protein